MNRFPNINSTEPSVEPRRSQVRAASAAATRRVSVSRWRALEAKQFRALVAAPRRRAVVAAVAAIVLTAGVFAHAEPAARYRDYQLGATLASVVSQSRAMASDVKTIHERPAVLQELLWRRPYSVALPAGAADPVQAIGFSFYNDQLYRIAIDYERARTSGMTDADMVEAISAMYGTASKPRVSAAIASPLSPSETETGTRVAEWGNADFSAVLYRSLYLSGFRLIVTSTPLGALARTADADARRMDDREAPQRELARQKEDAAAVLDSQEKARTTNKAAFTP